PKGSTGNRSYTALWTKKITSWSALQTELNAGGTVVLTEDLKVYRARIPLLTRPQRNLIFTEYAPWLPRMPQAMKAGNFLRA
ncbi:MAG: hypothetical protein II110_07185, partial [Treponema sp.]|nr:hypothetical protein [Treponema sp.]